MWNPDVCRLCLSNKQLVSVFENQENEDNNLKQIVFLTTGVEIITDDPISHKLCGNCHKVIVKIFEFRNKSSDTDKYLKEQYANHLKTTLTKSTENIIEKNNTEILSSKASTSHSTENVENTDKKSNKRKITKIHPTISNLYESCPNIKLPYNVLSFNIDPSVCMELNAVEEYFTRNNLDMNKSVQTILRSLRTSEKNNSVAKEQLTNDKKVDRINIKITDDKNKFKIAPRKHLKRKTTEQDMSSKIIKRNISTDISSPPTLMETLKLKPKDNVCEVCKSIQDSPETLKKHIEEKHLRCNFCKSMFKLAEYKDNHETSCVVKHILSSKSYVSLKMIDLDKEMIEKYQFLRNLNPKSKETSKADNLLCSEIIELSDDDEKSCPSSENDNLVPEPQKTNSDIIVDSPEDVNSFDISLVRPDVRVYNDDFLNYDNMPISDIDQLKQLITKNFLTKVRILVENETQIEYPDNKNIIKRPSVVAARFKGLKSSLYTFKIPIYIKNGDFNIEYTETAKRNKNTNKLWWDLKPIGLVDTCLNNTLAEVKLQNLDTKCISELNKYNNIFKNTKSISLNESKSINAERINLPSSSSDSKSVKVDTKLLLPKVHCLKNGMVLLSTVNSSSKTCQSIRNSTKDLQNIIAVDGEVSTSSNSVMKPLIRVKDICDLT